MGVLDWGGFGFRHGVEGWEGLGFKAGFRIEGFRVKDHRTIGVYGSDVMCRGLGLPLFFWVRGWRKESPKP